MGQAEAGLKLVFFNLSFRIVAQFIEFLIHLLDQNVEALFAYDAVELRTVIPEQAYVIDKHVIDDVFVVFLYEAKLDRGLVLPGLDLEADDRMVFLFHFGVKFYLVAGGVGDLEQVIFLDQRLKQAEKLGPLGLVEIVPVQFKRTLAKFLWISSSSGSRAMAFS